MVIFLYNLYIFFFWLQQYKQKCIDDKGQKYHLWSFFLYNLYIFIGLQSGGLANTFFC